MDVLTRAKRATNAIRGISPRAAVGLPELVSATPRLGRSFAQAAKEGFPATQTPPGRPEYPKRRGSGSYRAPVNERQGEIAGIRKLPIVPELSDAISRAVGEVYGPGHSATVYSGGQPHKHEGGRRTGSTRHDGGHAADIHIYGPDGRLTGDALAPLGQYWQAKRLGGTGMEMRGGGVHLDLHTDRAPSWNYTRQGGSYTPAQRAAIMAGQRGEMPDLRGAMIPPSPEANPVRLGTPLPQGQMARAGMSDVAPYPTNAPLPRPGPVLPPMRDIAAVGPGAAAPTVPPMAAAPVSPPPAQLAMNAPPAAQASPRNAPVIAPVDFGAPAAPSQAPTQLAQAAPGPSEAQLLANPPSIAAGNPPAPQQMAMADAPQPAPPAGPPLEPTERRTLQMPNSAGIMTANAQRPGPVLPQAGMQPAPAGVGNDPLTFTMAGSRDAGQMVPPVGGGAPPVEGAPQRAPAPNLPPITRSVAPEGGMVQTIGGPPAEGSGGVRYISFGNTAEPSADPRVDERRRLMAESRLLNSTGFRRIDHPMQGVAQMSEAAIGGLGVALANRRDNTRARNLAAAMKSATTGDMSGLWEQDPRMAMSLHQQQVAAQQATQQANIEFGREMAKIRAQQQGRLELERFKRDNPTPTNDIRTAQHLADNPDLLPTYEVMKQAGAARTNINTGGPAKLYSEPATGWAYVPDPEDPSRPLLNEEGQPRLTRTLGGPAEEEAQRAEEKRFGRDAAQGQKAAIVTQDATRAFDIISSNPRWTTGGVGTVMQRIPGRDAYDANQLLETVRSNTAFGEIQDMRNNSPTGGALGSVSDQEAQRLAAVRGSMDLGQSDEQLLENLARLNDLSLEIIHGVGDPRLSPEQQADARKAFERDALMPRFKRWHMTRQLSDAGFREASAVPPVVLEEAYDAIAEGRDSAAIFSIIRQEYGGRR